MIEKIDNLQNYNIEIIYPKIWVFKNAIKNCQQTIDYFKNNSEWLDWYGLGKMTRESGVGGNWNHFPSFEEFENDILNRVGDHRKEIDKAFYETTKIYASHHNINYDSWSFPNWGIAMYETNCGLNDELGMNYHTDFIQHEKDKPGSKFGITAFIYGNDNYEGGELCFKIFKDKNYNQVDELIYKPQEGDIIVFPSNEPYYHGTKIVTSGQKFIFRLYWKYYYSGSIIWKKMIEKYKDNFEEFEELEKERIVYVKNSDGGKIISGVYVILEDMATYYSKLNLLN